MPKVEVKKLSGEKKEDLNLKEEVFGVKRNDDLIHQVYVSQASNQRQNNAHTKTRAERRGSTRKPWRQKGTGRARVGTVRNPIWRKGGIVFGPRNERNYEKKINKKMKRAATKMVLSGKLADKEIIILENNDFKENKTKQAGAVLRNLNLEGSILWAFNKNEAEKSKVSRNLANVENISVDKLNVYDMLNKKYLILTKEGIKEIESKYLKEKSAESNKQDETATNEEK
ncbi:MAG: 50S ribosomal protein L4 [Candidatus Moraniibacteriota bacterium]